ncbi:hypothetical protein FNF27_08097 [Cafeteria roenbergensis]|uniref:Uncharacterized protein n=1 Tax=Cafeteria roenbergensis TaxID=33653 RepID=A0A5A8DB41_CAFRO|nr:hypothetical protein FNF27_08097 [Cafeteria roenbergensis]
MSRAASRLMASRPRRRSSISVSLGQAAVARRASLKLAEGPPSPPPRAPSAPASPRAGRPCVDTDAVSVSGSSVHSFDPERSGDGRAWGLSPHSGGGADDAGGLAAVSSPRSGFEGPTWAVTGRVSARRPRDDGQGKSASQASDGTFTVSPLEADRDGRQGGWGPGAASAAAAESDAGSGVELDGLGPMASASRAVRFHDLGFASWTQAAAPRKPKAPVPGSPVRSSTGRRLSQRLGAAETAAEMAAAEALALKRAMLANGERYLEGGPDVKRGSAAAWVEWRKRAIESKPEVLLALKARQYLVRRLRAHATKVGISRLEAVRAALGGDALEVAPPSAIRLKARVASSKTSDQLLGDGAATAGSCAQDKAVEQAAQRLRDTAVKLAAAAQRKGRRSSLLRRASATDAGAGPGSALSDGPDRLAGPVPRLDSARDVRLALRLRKPDCELGEQTAVALRSFQPAPLSLVSGSVGEDLLMLVRAAYSRGTQSAAGVV